VGGVGGAWRAGVPSGSRAAAGELTMGLRVVVVDDNPHVRWDGRVHPVNATFHRFLAGILDVPGGPVSSIVHCVPLRDAASPPPTLPLDPRLEVVGTAPFDGIAGYLRGAPHLVRRNARILRPVIASADLVWIKVPASNAPLAAWLAWRAGVPRFGYVAGSARAVARGRGLGLAAQAVGLAWDLAGRVAGGRHRVVVGEDLLSGRGIVTSLVEPDEIRAVAGAPWPAIPWRLRLAWAGRLAPGKGLETLLDALAALAASEPDGHRTELVIIGDGPARADLEARGSALGVADRIHWLGYVADRATYLDALATCDLFVFPSPAEGFPKVILDAMAVGLPVVAKRSGQVGRLIEARLIEGAGDTAADVATSVRALRDADADHLRSRRDEATAFVSAHTRPAETQRLADRIGLVARRDR
jgi:glycosyltransferase involved in cell wall biosynthesis